jgi:hypothetical protein
MMTLCHHRRYASGHLFISKTAAIWNQFRTIAAFLCAGTNQRWRTTR